MYWTVVLKILFATFFFAGLAACGDDSKMKDAIKNSLKDPDSAKFYENKVVGDRACYVINAKNSMGGYVGKKIAVLLKVNEKWNVLMIKELNMDDCLKLLQKME